MVRRLLALSLLGALGVACGGTPAARSAEWSGPSTARKSEGPSRESVAVTVYNQNFGVVREIRAVSLAKGKVELTFNDVSANIQPETVSIKPLGSADAFTVLEQNYRYDLLTPDKLLEKYLGKKIKVWRWNEAKGVEESFEAEVLAVEGGLVLRVNGEVTYGWTGRISFPEVPPNLIARPSLVWLLGSQVTEQRIEVSYVTRNVGWSADYVLVLDEKDQAGDLTGWVTLTNETGTSYRDARLKLVAGDVQRVAPEPPPMPAATPMEYAYSAAPPPQFTEESLFEYHLYALQRPTDLMDKEQKQVTLLEAHDIKLKKQLVLRGEEYLYRGLYGDPQPRRKVAVEVRFKNDEASGMGMPLPQGVVRVYKSDSSGARQFVGEDRIDHTPRDEKLAIKLGESFDVVADRKQLRWTALGQCQSESSWEVVLRNHKDVAEEVEVIEPAGGDWEITRSSHPAEREDAHSFRFLVPVAARKDVTITYTVRTRWC